MDLNENQEPSSSIIALKWGVIGAVVNFAITVIMKYSGLVDQFDETLGWVSTILSFAVTISILFLTLLEFRTQNNNELAYSKGLGLSTLLGAIMGLISAAFNYVYLEFIDNGIMIKQLELAREKMEDQGMSESQIQEAEKITSMMMGPGIQFVIIVIATIFMNFLFGLIVSAVLKREKPIFE
jgi:hypothetical protein